MQKLSLEHKKWVIFHCIRRVVIRTKADCFGITQFRVLKWPNSMWGNNYCEQHGTAVELHLTRAIKYCILLIFLLCKKAQFRAQENVLPIIIIASVVTLTRVAWRFLAVAIQATSDSGGRECPSSRSRQNHVVQHPTPCPCRLQCHILIESFCNSSVQSKKFTNIRGWAKLHLSILQWLYCFGIQCGAQFRAGKWSRHCG